MNKRNCIETNPNTSVSIFSVYLQINPYIY